MGLFGMSLANSGTKGKGGRVEDLDHSPKVVPQLTAFRAAA